MSYPWAAFGQNMGVTAIALVILMASIMAVAIRIRNQSIIDIFWGPGFVVIALVSYVLSGDVSANATRRFVVLSLTTLWGLRLGAHIAIRNRGRGEDRRYTALMKTRSGSLVGLVVRKIYGVQGLLLWVISLPIQFAMYERQPLGVVGVVAIVLWLIGFAFEAIGDWQLSRFKADPTSSGHILDRGLWAWTRHPNYFGDSCVWVALFLLSLGTPWGIVTVISPIAMVTVILRYSGKSLLEKQMRRSRGPAYDDYAARTSGFFPRPPRKSPLP